MQHSSNPEIKKSPADTSAVNENDAVAISTIISTMQQGWNAKDVRLFSSVFDDEHDYIVLNGLYFPGMTSQENAKAHQDLFDGIYKEEDVEMRIDRIRLISNNLLLVTAFSSRYQKNSSLPEHPNSIMTILVEKKNQEWKIISFHNHALDSSVHQGPLPMKLMYAGWYK